MEQSWSDLPSDLLGLIVSRFETIEDIRLIRLVCKSWNSSISADHSIDPLLHSLHSKLPRKFHTTYLPEKSLRDTKRQPVLIVPVNVYILRRSFDGGRWLIGVEQLSRGKVRLVHPLTGGPIQEHLPENFPKLLRNFCPLRISTRYSFRFTDSINPVLKQSRVSKVIYWKKPGYIRGSNVAEESLMLLYDKGTLKCINLLGNNRFYSKQITNGNIERFHDIVKWKDMIVAVDGNGRLFVIEYKTMVVTNIIAASSSIGDETKRRKRLVEWNGHLYLVVKKHSSTSYLKPEVKIEVYELNIETSLWEKLTSLGDRVLFVNFDDCFFVKSNDLLPGDGIGNCIVFSRHSFNAMKNDDDFSLTRDEYLFEDVANKYFKVGVYNYTPSDNFSLLSPDSTLGTAFWPPPPWIFKTEDGCRAQRDEVTKADKSKKKAKKAKKRERKEKHTESTIRNSKKHRTSAYMAKNVASRTGGSHLMAIKLASLRNTPVT